jgi:hypothetical protein
MSSRLCAVSPIAAAIDGPEVILPCQYYDLAGGERRSGEQRLMFALLVDAINVYQRGMLSSASKARRLSIEAEQWIMTQHPVGGALTFDLACDAVGLEPRLLRRRLLAWKHSLYHRYNRQACLHLTSVPRVRSAVRRRGRPPQMPVIPV